MGFSKCSLIPEQSLTYLRIDCDTKQGRFLVPQERINKYAPPPSGLCFTTMGLLL